MKKTRGAILALAYVLTVVAANYAVTHWGMVGVGFGLSAPAGVYFAGLAFSLRDFTQEALGKRAVLAAILAGTAVSYLLGDGRIALAGAVAFAFSELLDLSVYTKLREKGWLRAVTVSNVVGLVVDSALFLWLAFGSLSFLSGQIVGKAWMTALAVVLIAVARSAVRRQVAVAA